jgi:hypothetical protein
MKSMLGIIAMAAMFGEGIGENGPPQKRLVMEESEEEKKATVAQHLLQLQERMEFTYNGETYHLLVQKAK